MKEKSEQERKQKRFTDEVTRIRNSKKDLLSLLREMKYSDARIILYIQILKQAYDEYKKNSLNVKNKKLLYEVIWALNEMKDLMPKINAPKPMDPKLLMGIAQKDPSLVYDNAEGIVYMIFLFLVFHILLLSFSFFHFLSLSNSWMIDAFSLLKKANKILENEEDLIRLQLVDMSDALPPLSKFSSGFKLDEWQKRVLTWIDAGKSVIICAPTSSGKTVLSSYVAIIFKSQVGKDDEGTGGEGSGKYSKKGGVAGTKKEQPLIKQATKKAISSSTGEEEEEEDEVDDDEDDEGEELFDNEDFTFDEPTMLKKQQQEESEAEFTDETAVSSVAAEQQETTEQEDYTQRLIQEDAEKRKAFLSLKRELQLHDTLTATKSNQLRVLFVVPTEPLVWQVAAYFTKLMKEEGDRQTRVSLVTDQLVFRPKQKVDVMSQIVVGTPFALESALTKPRGLTGLDESKGLGAGNIIPGGFDHFDWVIYDEVHALDGSEGAALQRLIRSMNCPFLALSATIGNAEQLRSWFEKVKGEQLTSGNSNVETLTINGDGSVAPAAASAAAVLPPVPPSSNSSKPLDIEELHIIGRGGSSNNRGSVSSSSTSVRIGIIKTLLSNIMIYEISSLSDLYDHLSSIWKNLSSDSIVLNEIKGFQLLLQQESPLLIEDNVTIEQTGLLVASDSHKRVLEGITTNSLLRSAGEEDSAASPISTTIIGSGSSSVSKVTVSSKFTFTLPSLSLPETAAVNDVLKLLADLFPLLLSEVVSQYKRQEGIKFLNKGSELKEVDASSLLSEVLTSSKNNEKTLETSFAFPVLDETAGSSTVLEIMQLINTFNLSVSSSLAEGTKTYNTKMNLSLFLPSFEVFILNNSTTVVDLKNHCFALWSKYIQNAELIPSIANMMTPTLQLYFKNTSNRILENHLFNRFGLFHPSVDDSNRTIMTSLVVKDREESNFILYPTVVGRSSQSVRTISVKKYLQALPTEVLLTKDVTLGELKAHLLNAWKETKEQGTLELDVKDKNVLSIVGSGSSSKGGSTRLIDLLPSSASSAASGSFPCFEVTTSSSTTSSTLQKELSSSVNLSFLTVIGKGNQQPFRLRIIRTTGTIRENVSTVFAEIIVFADTTIGDLKKQVCTIWSDLNPAESGSAASGGQIPAHIRYPVQLLYHEKDISSDNTALLSSYNLLEGDESERHVIVRSLVQLLIHQGRFINLQRYIWDQSTSSSLGSASSAAAVGKGLPALVSNGKLIPISPLAAISSPKELADGILYNSSLSFTSKDCYKTFEEMKKIFPKSVIDTLSPYAFFGKTERITLQRTKEYEDFLKITLTTLAKEDGGAKYKKEFESLLKVFKIYDTSREFNLCDLVLDLKERDMLPCLPFHLNTFEAIKLFQQLLCDLEYRQKISFPTYYSDIQSENDRKNDFIESQKKSTGLNYPFPFFSSFFFMFCFSAPSFLFSALLSSVSPLLLYPRHFSMRR
jgi:hypothetical protein